MKWMWVILAALGVAGIFGLMRYAGWDAPPWALFPNATYVVKLTDMLLVAMFVLVALVGLIELGTSKNARGSQFLTVMVLVAVGFGVLAAVYTASHVSLAIQNSHTTNMRVVAPGVAEGLLPLTLGFIIAAVASILNAMIKSNGRRSAAAQAAS